MHYGASRTGGHNHRYIVPYWSVDDYMFAVFPSGIRLRNSLPTETVRRPVPRIIQTCFFFCEVYFLGQNAPCGKSVFRNITYKEGRFIRSGLSLTLGGADRVEKAKTDILSGVIYRYLECLLCMG